MKLQRINDERLIIENLKNIRLVYVVQTLGILGLLGYDVIANGLGRVFEHPLWLVLVASTIVLAFLSLRSDERVAFKNLQKIRIAYAVQLLGIVGVFGYDLVTKSVNSMWESPLWFVFTVSTLILIGLSMNVSVDYENNKKSSGKWLAISSVIVLVISVVVGVFTVISNDTATFLDGLLIGGILFICGFLSFLFLFGLRKSKASSE